MNARTLIAGLAGVALISLALGCEKGNPASTMLASRPAGLRPSTFPLPHGNIGNPADGRAGLLVVRVAYSDGSEGSLVVSCNFAGTATADVFEGVTASKGRTDFWNRAAPAMGVAGNRTAFHVID